MSVDADQADRTAGRGEAAEPGGEVVNGRFPVRCGAAWCGVGIFGGNILVVGEIGANGWPG